MEKLLKAIETHLRRRKEAPSTFGRRAVGDPALVTQLRGGRQVLPSTEAKIRLAIKHYPRKETVR